MMYIVLFAVSKDDVRFKSSPTTIEAFIIKLLKIKNMGGYDLYGTYYPNMNDAINAEMAQCASIDADIAMREVNNMKKRLNEQSQHPDPLSDEFQNIWEHIKVLEERVVILESKINNQ